jgi:hypothetical protein
MDSPVTPDRRVEIAQVAWFALLIAPPIALAAEWNLLAGMVLIWLAIVIAFAAPRP